MSGPDCGPHEPLAASAHLARRWAEQHCVHDGTGRRCDAYHGFWQTMRLMCLGATLGGHAGTYLEALARWATRANAAGAPCRVLVSGCADYSMLAHVWHATQAMAPAPELTVLDICPTPLLLNSWYAERIGRPVETVCGDILSHQPQIGYDLIVTSSFLGFFSPSERPDLFRAYRRMLRDGGQLMFSNRLRDAPEHTPVGFSAEQALQLADSAARCSGDLPAEAALDAAQAHAMALAFAHHTRNYPLQSRQTIAELADASGLRLRDCHPVRSAPMRPELSGPTLGDGSTYLFAVLQR